MLLHEYALTDALPETGMPAHDAVILNREELRLWEEIVTSLGSVASGDEDTPVFNQLMHEQQVRLRRERDAALLFGDLQPPPEFDDEASAVLPIWAETIKYTKRVRTRQLEAELLNRVKAGIANIPRIDTYVRAPIVPKEERPPMQRRVPMANLAAGTAA